MHGVEFEMRMLLNRIVAVAWVAAFLATSLTTESRAGNKLYQGAWVAGIGGSCSVSLANHGDADVESFELRATVGPAQARPIQVPSIGGRQTVTVPFEVTFPSTGYESLTVAAPPDRLAADDSRFCSVHVASAVRILVVDGEPSSDPVLDETKLLSTALSPEGRVFSGNSVRVADEFELESGDWGGGDVQVVVLANVYRVSEAAAKRLEAFVRNGGGLLVFAGDQLDAVAYNQILYRDGAGLLPAALTDIVQTCL